MIRKTFLETSSFHKTLNIAVIARRFPQLSETFVLQHVVSLLEMEYSLDIFSFSPPDPQGIKHESVKKHRLLDKTFYFPERPASQEARRHYLATIKKQYKNKNSIWLERCLDPQKYSPQHAFLNLFYTAPFLGKRYEVIHCHFGPIGKRLCLLKDIFPRLKFFVTFHGYGIRLGKRGSPSLYTELFNKADGIISICDYNRRKLIELGCPREKIIYLPNSVDTDTFSYRQHKPSSPFKIMTVARLARMKNILFALHVMKEIKEEKKYDFRYYIIGEGPYRPQIESAILDYGLSKHAFLLGALADWQLKQVLQEADIFFLPSQKEAFPVCLLEAQAMGIPVISTDVGGVREGLEHGRTGYLISVNDIQEAKRHICTLFKKSHLISQMGERARYFIENNFSHQEWRQKYRQIYDV